MVLGDLTKLKVERKGLESEDSELESGPPRCCEGVFVKAGGQNAFYLTFC